jgi:F-type H+-transporting ATPase subunit b
MTIAKLQPWLVCVALLSVPALALADGEEEAAEAAEAVEEGHGGHHGGPLHFSEVLHNPELWTAALNFTLLLILLRRFGAAPVRDFLVGRRKTMEQAINEAAEAKRAAEAKLAEYNGRLATLDSELAKLRSDLVAAGEEDKKRIVAEAEESAIRTKRETESLVDQHAKQLQTSVRHDMVEAAVAAAEAMVRQKLAPGDQERLADAYKQRIASQPSKTRSGGLPS